MMAYYVGNPDPTKPPVPPPNIHTRGGTWRCRLLGHQRLIGMAEDAPGWVVNRCWRCGDTNAPLPEGVQFCKPMTRPSYTAPPPPSGPPVTSVPPIAFAQLSNYESQYILQACADAGLPLPDETRSASLHFDLGEIAVLRVEIILTKQHLRQLVHAFAKLSIADE